MRLYILDEYTKNTITENPIGSIPVDMEGELMPLYYLFTGTRLYSEYTKNSNYGLNYYNGLNVSCIHKDKIDHYKDVYDIAVNYGNSIILIDNNDITILKYKYSKMFTSFPDKIEKEKLLKETAKEMILEHLNIEKELNIELI